MEQDNVHIQEDYTSIIHKVYSCKFNTCLCSVFVIVGFFFQLLQSSTSESQSSAEALKSVLHKKPLDMRESKWILNIPK